MEAFCWMEEYLDICRDILDRGVKKENRTGVDALSISGAMFSHDMSGGFPLLTTKKVPYGIVRSELEFFIKGKTDKKWLQERNNRIWNEWANPLKAPYGHDKASKERMASERDLGPVYGFEWRHWGADYDSFDTDYTGEGVDQLEGLVDTLKNNPFDRRMIVSAWNPSDKPKQALPPCHYSFQVLVGGDEKLNLLWNQRSVDVPLGLPFNIASYATLLHLLAKESGREEGTLTGFLADTHIYVNQVDGIREQLSRVPRILPRIETPNFRSLFDWEFEDTELDGYEPYPPIKFDIAV